MDGKRFCPSCGVQIGNALNESAPVSSVRDAEPRTKSGGAGWVIAGRFLTAIVAIMAIFYYPTIERSSVAGLIVDVVANPLTWAALVCAGIAETKNIGPYHELLISVCSIAIAVCVGGMVGFAL